MPSKELYYRIKPIVPRFLQIFLRRQWISLQRRKFKEVWPIDRDAGMTPDGFGGWPEGKTFAFVLTHDVDTARGQDRCLRLMESDERFGFRSSFNFVPERYDVDPGIRSRLAERGFEVGVHGLRHDGDLFRSREIFLEHAERINRYLKDWGAVGFRSPSMHHNLEWIAELEIEYDASTFDTDPFEPQPDGVGTIFPFRVPGQSPRKEYVELPYTLAQDFTLFVLMREKTIRIWKEKLDWIVDRGGMALVNTHPDYMRFDGQPPALEEYSVGLYEDFLEYVGSRYAGKYWHALPREVSAFWSTNAIPQGT